MSAKQIETLLESAPRPSSGRKRTQVSTYAADDSVGLDLVKKKARKESAASIKPNADIIQFTQPIPSRNSHGELVFADFPTFRPNLTPAEVLQLGSFGGTYYRPIYSSVTHTQYDNEAFKELPADWTAGLNIPKMVTSSTYRLGVNKYKESCGQGLEEWESSGWITAYDSYGKVLTHTSVRCCNNCTTLVRTF